MSGRGDGRADGSPAGSGHAADSSAGSLAAAGTRGDLPRAQPMCLPAPDRLLGTPECVDCLCEVNARATMGCTGDCWRLLYCVAASGCQLTDVDCIRHDCVAPLGGLDGYMNAAMQLARTPFMACELECLVEIFENDGGETAGE